MSTLSTPTASTTSTKEIPAMTTNRPEQQDVFGLWHRHGCPATSVTVTRSFLKKKHTFVRCLDCGSAALVPDHEEEVEVP